MSSSACSADYVNKRHAMVMREKPGRLRSRLQLQLTYYTDQQN